MSQASVCTTRWIANTVKNTERIKVNSFIISMGSNCDCYPAQLFRPAGVLVLSGNGEAIPAVARAHKDFPARILTNLLCIVAETGIAAGLIAVIFQVLPVYGHGQKLTPHNRQGFHCNPYPVAPSGTPRQVQKVVFWPGITGQVEGYKLHPTFRIPVNLNVGTGLN